MLSVQVASSTVSYSDSPRHDIGYDPSNAYFEEQRNSGRYGRQKRNGYDSVRFKKIAEADPELLAVLPSWAGGRSP